MKKIYRTEGTEPACPKCGNWNAMLNLGSARDYKMIDDEVVIPLICRDCDYRVEPGEYEVVVKDYDDMPSGPY